jgi:hypothetical protein
MPTSPEKTRMQREPVKTITMKRIYLRIIILLSLIGGGTAIHATANGPWGYTDPVEYISTASSILHARGLGYYEGTAKFKLISLHPPFYSLVLSAIGLSGINLVAAARWLNIFAFVASIFLAGWIFWRYTKTSAVGAAASALLLLFPAMITAFSSAYSEPLFILLAMAGAACLFQFLKKGKTAAVIWSALLFGAGALTRNAGLAIAGAGALVVFFFSAGNKRERIKKTLLFAAISGLPTLLWFAYVYITSNHSLGGRSLELDWNTLAAQFQSFRGIFMDTTWKWLPFSGGETSLHYAARFIILGVVSLITLILTFLADRKLRKKGHSAKSMPVFIFFSLSLLFYLAFLVETYLFTLPTIDIDNRMLLPIYVCLVMTLLAAFSTWKEAWLEGKLRWLQALPWIAAALCAYWYIPQSLDKIDQYHQGEGLTAYFWNHSDTIEAVRKLPANVQVISNDWELLLLWTDRPIHGFWNTFPTSQTTTYGTNPVDAVQTLFCSQQAALVVFKDFSTQYESQGDEPLTNPEKVLMGALNVYGIYPDGTIYTCP